MSAVEFSSLSKRDSVASISSAFDFRQFTSATANTGNEFLGLSLPLDLSTLFQTEQYTFQGSWADHFVSTPTLLPPFVVNKKEKEKSSSHDKSRCLGCMHSNWVGSGRERTKSSDQVSDGEWNRLTPVMEAKFERADAMGECSLAESESSSSVSSSSTPVNKSKLDEHTKEGKRLIRDEILRIVASLSSVVASRSHQESLSS